MFAAVIILLVVVGTVVFHFWSPWWWTEIASNWGYVDDTIIVTFWITGVVFVAILLFVVYCMIRFRHREGQRAEYEPENTKLEWWLTGLTTVGVAAMLTPGLFVWGHFVSVPDDAVEFEVLAQQWQWTYRLPGEDGILGTSDAKNIDFDNTFGLNPDDPNGQDDILVESDELHLELDQPVKVLLRSIDVLHNFYVPQFRAKMDMVPGASHLFLVHADREPGPSTSCVSSCAAWALTPCVARSWWRTQSCPSGLGRRASDLRRSCRREAGNGRGELEIWCLKQVTGASAPAVASASSGQGRAA